MASPVAEDHKISHKKLAKKIMKIEKCLSAKEDIVVSKDKTKVLCVQNGGLGNGVSQEELIPLFSKFGNLEGIVMLPQKQFCFVCYTDSASAGLAQQELNGFLLRKGSDPTQDVFLYLCFVEKAPPSISPSSERPPGLDIVEEFVSEDTEQALIDLMDFDMEGTSKDTSEMKHRKVKHFGFEFKYGINDVDVTDPLRNGIPHVCNVILNKAKDMGLIQHLPDQLTINSYQSGQGIPAHVDTREAFEDGILSLSLGSQIVMDFRHPDGKHISVLLPRRSLMVMRGESRYIWSHGITPRKSDIVPAQTANSLSDGSDCSVSVGGLTLQARNRRVSYTFRKVVMDRQAAKDVIFDATGMTGQIPDDAIVPRTDEEAVALERKHVNKVYEDIAEHFSGTRYKPWPRVVDFLMEQPPSSLLADVGCGNGKCLGANKELFEIGSDFSSNLAAICHSRGFETCVGDVTRLPFRTGSFDVVLCIAVIHHMATKHRRLKALSEVIRILRKEGRALVYVWAMEQELNKAQSKYIKPSRQQKLEDPRSLSTRIGPSTCDNTAIDANSENLDRSLDTQINQVNTEPSVNTESEGSTAHHLQPGATGHLGRNDDKGAATARNKCDGHNEEVSYSQVGTGVSQISVRHVNHEPLKNEFVQQNACSSGEDAHDNSLESQKKLTVHVNRTQFKDQDLLVPWQLKAKTAGKNDTDGSERAQKGDLFHRFYHVFRQGELEAMCKRVAGCVVTKSYYDQGNWCVVLEKL